MVIELRPEMRVWKNVFFCQNFIENLLTKGISSLKHFKLHIWHYYSQNDMDVLATWKDCLTGLKVHLDKPEVSIPHFPNLETLEFDHGNREDAETG